ncbi:hypothetical protein QBC40DRAFT_301217 [Triangularia verruculosa]|uniref:Uncharacterized protein n=1 Tax=Triangularia verruculosa TaxID=2587418 RepID=A0AAN6X9N8_9PEZI|nr:hypothetical protein QBC40DRAFT_301217 [Triangularia verruculosa]
MANAPGLGHNAVVDLNFGPEGDYVARLSGNHDDLEGWWRGKTVGRDGNFLLWKALRCGLERNSTSIALCTVGGSRSESPNYWHLDVRVSPEFAMAKSQFTLRYALNLPDACPQSLKKRMRRSIRSGRGTVFVNVARYGQKSSRCSNGPAACQPIVSFSNEVDPKGNARPENRTDDVVCATGELEVGSPCRPWLMMGCATKVQLRCRSMDRRGCEKAERPEANAPTSPAPEKQETMVVDCGVVVRSTSPPALVFMRSHLTHQPKRRRRDDSELGKLLTARGCHLPTTTPHNSLSWPPSNQARRLPATWPCQLQMSAQPRNRRGRSAAGPSYRRYSTLLSPEAMTSDVEPWYQIRRTREQRYGKIRTGTPKSCELQLGKHAPSQVGYFVRSDNPTSGGIRESRWATPPPRTTICIQQFETSTSWPSPTEITRPIGGSHSIKMVPEARRDWYSLLKLAISKNNAARHTVGFTEDGEWLDLAAVELPMVNA